MLQPAASYEAARDRFRWTIPAAYNIGVDVADRHADSDRTALIELGADGAVRRYGFRDLMRLSNRLANLLAARVLGRGGRIGILLPPALGRSSFQDKVCPYVLISVDTVSFTQKQN